MSRKQRDIPVQLTLLISLPASESNALAEASCSHALNDSRSAHKACLRGAQILPAHSQVPGPYQGNLNSEWVETLKLVHHVLSSENAN
jgi:hypothetical protein